MANFRDYTWERLGRSEKVSTYPTLNDPVLLFNRFRIYEVICSLIFVVIFGVLRSEWLLTLGLVLLMLIGSPAIRKKVPPSLLLRKVLDRFSSLKSGKYNWGKIHSPY